MNKLNLLIGDKMKIVELNNNSDLDLLVAIAETYKKTDDELKAIIKELKHDLSEAGDNRIISIAYEEDKVVAMIQLILNKADNDPELADGKNICHVHNLQVRSDHQKQGIGWKMMDFIEEQAKQLGKKVITLGVDGDNHRAIKMYKNRDYKIFKEGEGRTPEEFGYSMRKDLN